MHTLKFVFFSAILSVFISCNSGKKPKVIISKSDSSVVQNTVKAETDTFIKYSIDTSHYSSLPYYDTTMSKNGGDGYVDTFTVHNCSFRIVHHDTLYDGVVEKYKEGAWLRTMAFEVLGNHNGYDISRDLDGDGYKDLIFYWKWFGEVHFFDTLKNEFCDTVNCNIGKGWSVVDSANHIFCENEFGKLMHSPVHSNLFTFKNAKRIDIATLNIEYEPQEENMPITALDLYKEGNSKPVESITPGKNNGIDDFDTAAFWAARYKKLMNLP